MAGNAPRSAWIRTGRFSPIARRLAQTRVARERMCPTVGSGRATQRRTIRYLADLPLGSMSGS